MARKAASAVTASLSCTRLTKAGESGTGMMSECRAGESERGSSVRHVRREGEKGEQQE